MSVATRRINRVGSSAHCRCQTQIPSRDGYSTTIPTLLAAACWLCVYSPLRGADDVDQALVQMVADSIHANYSHIRSAELTIRETTKDASVSNAHTEVLNLSIGGVARIQRTPTTVRETRVWLRGESVRVDRSQANKAVEDVHETLVRHDGVWTQHVGPSNAAWRRRPSEMPGMFPQDPRDFGSQDVRRSMADVLGEDAILTAQMEMDAEGRAIAQMVTRGAKGNETTYEFCAEELFLPTRLTTHWPDGSILQLAEIRYQRVLDGKARFPETLVRMFFEKSTAFAPTRVGWREKLTREVTSEITLNEQIADSVFQPDIPAGTRVSDNFRQAVVPNGRVSADKQQHAGRGTTQPQWLPSCLRLW